MFAGFPAGTVTVATKIRAIEIIDELRKNDKMIKVTIDNYETN